MTCIFFDSLGISSYNFDLSIEELVGIEFFSINQTITRKLLHNHSILFNEF